MTTPRSVSPIKIGTRGSELALWQARHVAELIEKITGIPSELTIIKTTGDMILAVPLSEVGGKGLFVKEIEEALLDRSIDLAVHSMKDVPAYLPEGLILGAILSREDPRDAFVSVNFPALEALPPGARVGTSSLRRIAQLRHFRSDLEFKALRGNVGTRLRKLEEGQVDAIILAAAGLIRLGFAERIRQYLPPSLSLPAVGQGALGLEIRQEDSRMGEILSRINDKETSLCVQAERGFLEILNGGCQLPLAAQARFLPDSRLEIVARVLNPEGTVLLEEILTGETDRAYELGARAGKKLLERGGKALLEAVLSR